MLYSKLFLFEAWKYYSLLLCVISLDFVSFLSLRIPMKRHYQPLPVYSEGVEQNIC